MERLAVKAVAAAAPAEIIHTSPECCFTGTHSTHGTHGTHGTHRASE